MESESHQTWEFEGRHERGEAQYDENPLILYPTRKRNENRSESPPRKKIDTEFLLQSKDKTPLEVVEDDVEMEMSIANTTLRRYISSSLLFTVLSLYFFRSGINQFFFYSYSSLSSIFEINLFLFWLFFPQCLIVHQMCRVLNLLFVLRPC